MKPIITVVSGTYNRLNLLTAMVASARAALPRGIALDFVIVDGGSNDGTQAWCKSQADINILEQGELLGAINAFNAGAALARGKYIVLANDDVTFFEGSLLKALIHLENQTNCGAVAFKDNRPIPPYTDDLTLYKTLKAPAMKNGTRIMAIYAQVGMFRGWLGDALNWWRGHDELFTSRTYGGDNRLSSDIWAHGYTVEEVEGCAVHDTVIDDGLRAINREYQLSEPDSAYYKLWTDSKGNHIGPTIPPKPTLDNPDKRQLRILYMPIFETNQAPELGPSVQQQQKRGLREALQKVGLVYEYDYVNRRTTVEHDLNGILHTFQPDMMLTQLHGADIVTPEMLARLRQQYPGVLVVNWNGDTHRANLVNPTMLKLLKHIDLQLVVNLSVIPDYEANGTPAAYWQCAFEPVDDPLPDVPQYDVVFQGTAYNEQRKALGVMLREMLGDKFGIYGDWWESAGIEAQGRTLYDFRLSTALYRNAKIAIGSNEFPDDYGFVSNRIFEAMGAGGCLFLMQPVPGLKELTGITAGEHYIEWTDLADLKKKLTYLLSDENILDLPYIAGKGTQFVRTHHSFDARVKQLFVDLLPLASRKLENRTALRYQGKMDTQFGVLGYITSQQYTVEPKQILYVDNRDAPFLIRDGLFTPVEKVEASYG